MRLDKYLADLGLGSRKEVKQLLHQKRVCVNGAIITDGRFQVSLDDEVIFNGEQLHYEKMIYLLYYKPKGVICANEDAMHRTIFDEIDHPQVKQLFSVGRLDLDTTGALIITNDGKLDHRLRSLKHHVDKVYVVTLKEKFDVNFIASIETGIVLEDGTKCAPAKIEIKSDHCVILTLQEGKYHQVKRMMVACNNEVIALHRSHFAFLDLTGLQENTYRKLTEDEIGRLKK